MRILSLLLLLLLALIAALVWPAAAQTATPFPTFPPVFTSTPLIPPTSTIPPSPTCAAPLPLTLGTQVLLRGGVNLRSLPSLSGAVVNYYSAQEILLLVNGPVCADGYNWWYVSGNGQPGWVVEGQPGRYFMKAFVNPAAICPTPQAIQIGGQLRTITGSRVRQTPGNAALVVTDIPAGTTLTVTGGPACADNMNWWRVRVPFGNSGTLVDGWVAEGVPGAFFVAGAVATETPTLSCAAPLRLHVGSRAAVTYNDGVPRRLRAAPSSNAAVVANLLDGIAFDVINGDSVCADGYNWWQVQVVGTGLTGWLAEGRPGSYWFQVLIN